MASHRIRLQRHADRGFAARLCVVALSAGFCTARAQDGFARASEHDWRARAALDELRLDDAERELCAALESAPDLDRRAAEWWTILADVARNRDELPAAFFAIERGHALAGAIDAAWARLVESDLFALEGRMWSDLGALDLARESARRAAEVVADDADAFARLRIVVLRAEIENSALDFEAVESLLADPATEDECRRSATELLPRLLGLRGVARSEAARDAGRTASDARADLEALSTLANAGPDDLLMAHLTLAEIESREGHLERSRARLAAARAVLDELPSPSPRDRARCAAQSVTIALAEGRGIEIARDELDDSFRAWCASVERTPPRRGGLAFLHYGARRRIVSLLVRSELALDPGPSGRERALAHVVRAQALGSLGRRLGARVPSLAEIRAALCAKGRGVVVVLPALDRSHVFAVDGESIVEAEAPRRDVLVSLADELRRSVSASPGDEDRALRAVRQRTAAARFGEALLRPAIADRVETWSSVAFAGLDLAGSPPIACVPLPDGRVLGLDFAISTMPSVPLGVLLAERARERAAEREVDCAFLASPDRSRIALPGDPPDVALDDDDRAALVDPFGSARVLAATGSAASIDALDDPRARSARLWVVLVHGAFDPAKALERERPAELLLAPGRRSSRGRVGCREIEALDSAEIVELLCCGSMRSPQRLGEDGGAHLGGAFFAAGARAVVISSADVAYGATVDLAAVAHERLRQGDELGEAYRRARRALASEPRTSDPYYWALFDVVGDARARPFDAPRTTIGSAAATTAAVGAVVAAGLLLHARRRRRAERTFTERC